MDLLVVLATFAVVFPAELPDKSMFAAVVMGTRFRPLPVWLGLAAAFAVHVVIAVAAGGVIGLLPRVLVIGVVALVFLAGAALLLLGNEQDEQAEGEAEGAAFDEVDPRSPIKVATAAFAIIFVSEWGDLTQIATVNLAARYDEPFSVGVGALSALWLVTGLGVLLGRRLMRSVPLGLARRVAGLVLLGLAIWSAVDFVKVVQAL